MSRELPEHVREKARIHLLDTRAAIVSGANLEAGIAGQRYAESLKGLATVAILGTSRTCAKSG
jgi:2-methylcitrate dehydratase PrpD